MRIFASACIAAALLIAATGLASAQKKPPPPPAPAAPYKPVAITPPAPVSDPYFDAMRRQLGEIAQKKDRAALARLVVEQGFFWEREDGNRADKRKSGVDNLATALGLNNKSGVGWEILFSYSDDPSASASSEHKGAICTPAEPAFDDQAFENLLKATKTDASEWSYPLSPGLEVRAAPHNGAAVIDKLAVVFVRVIAENGTSSANYMRIVTPAGKAGYVSADALAPIGNDQLCYVKDASGSWKIGGFIGVGEP